MKNVANTNMKSFQDLSFAIIVNGLYYFSYILYYKIMNYEEEDCEQS